MNRGTRRWNVFLDDVDRWRFLDLLAEMAERFDIDITAYTLMGNHYHIVVYCRSPNLSEAMHWFISQYVRGFNKRHGFDGTLFRSRFHSVEITDEPQLLTTVRYVHRNPLDLDPATDLARYLWSSHAAYLGWKRTPPWLSTGPVLAQFAGTRRYQEFVEKALPTDDVQNTALSRPHSSGSPELQSGRLSAPADIQRAAATAAGIDVRSLQRPVGRPAKRARLVALVLCVEICNLSPKSLVDIFGFPSEGAVSTALSRARRRIETDYEFASLATQARTALKR